MMRWRVLVSEQQLAGLDMVRESRKRIAGRMLLGAAIGLIVLGLAGPQRSAAASSSDRAAGAELFKEKGCEHCHGANGIGMDRAPSLTTVGKRLKKNEIESQIRDGGKQMPPFGDVLNDKEMHDLVEYLAHNKKAPKPAPGS